MPQKELRRLCIAFDDIVDLYERTRGGAALVRDLVRSMTLLENKPMEGSFEEVSMH
jgi:hypothetical protein